MVTYSEVCQIFGDVITDIKKAFGLRMKELRSQRSISQDAFAYSIGMARSYFAAVETGKRNISLENIARIAEGFGIGVDELFDSPLFSYDSTSDCGR